MFPFRKNTRAIRWGLVLLLISLHLAMKAPVWMLINHVDLVAGNSGYHRAMLIDACVNHFSEWWLIGVNPPRIGAGICGTRPTNLSRRRSTEASLH